jgi:hypothetical protein
MVVLYAEPPLASRRVDASMTPFDVAELDRLRSEGHTVVQDKRGHILMSSPESIAATRRRSWLHEIGHHIDRKRDTRSFARKPKLEAEKFAESYAARHLPRATSSYSIAPHIPWMMIEIM